MPTSNPPEEPLELFYSYAHADEACAKNWRNTSACYNSGD
jgi:hypothetical protein